MEEDEAHDYQHHEGDHEDERSADGVHIILPTGPEHRWRGKKGFDHWLSLAVLEDSYKNSYTARCPSLFVAAQRTVDWVVAGLLRDVKLASVS